MDLMPLELHWNDVLIRVVLALIAGALIGLDRSEAGKSAGLRTTMLVCLAACLGMLQANALLAQAGKHSDSFAVLDLMRLPLGILTGMGFIGAGAVLRRDGLVTGVTTAATLWFVTVIGLCFGGGQLELGVLGLVLGLVVLWVLHGFEQRLKRDRSAWLTVEYERIDADDGNGGQDPVPRGSAARDVLLGRLREAGFQCVCRGMRDGTGRDTVEERFVVSWRERYDAEEMPKVLTSAATSVRLTAVCWSMS